jgi:hypothetical protein
MQTALRSPVIVGYCIARMSDLATSSIMMKKGGEENRHRHPAGGVEGVQATMVRVT